MLDTLSNNKEAAVSAAATRPVKASPFRQRNALLAFSPLVIIAGACLVSAGQRAISDLWSSHGGVISRQDVEQVARQVCTRMTGTAPIELHDASLQYAYSRRRNSVIREWNIVCETEQGQYLLRINAMTGNVYAINKISDTVGSSLTGDDKSAGGTQTADGGSLNLQSDKPLLTRAEAEQHARQYLSLLGISPTGLTTLTEEAPHHSVTPSQWNFTFRRYVPGMGQRLLKVSISGKDGDLEDAWNPVYAL